MNPSPSPPYIPDDVCMLSLKLSTLTDHNKDILRTIGLLELGGSFSIVHSRLHAWLREHNPHVVTVAPDRSAAFSHIQASFTGALDFRFFNSFVELFVFCQTTLMERN